ncbi:hypothetical protein VIS19158_03841 [Vibrio scophthalmi LMG 19158]|uniref:Uncharacterized protein n=1 Tax=Vibrio scophthalmi LMG 19158 TaxID=870967 RepID=F9RKR8_9VIBR|nr:hypothetical protein VIS19158_03841 [Vibrio scophthalmi LMG 19158]
MQTRKPANVELVEFKCDDCQRGVYRVSDNQRNAMWPHKCTYCQKEVLFPFPYPCIEFNGERFVLDKHVKRDMPKPTN